MIDIDSRRSRILDVGERSSLDSIGFSRDFKKIVFSLERNSEKDVMLLDLENETLTNISRSKSRDYSPRLAKNGQLVLFGSDRDRERALYLADLDRGLMKRVTGTGRAGWPWLSPDGSMLIYPTRGSILKRSLETGDTQEIFSSRDDSVGSMWISDDGKRILFTRESDRGFKYQFLEISADKR